MLRDVLLKWLFVFVIYLDVGTDKFRQCYSNGMMFHQIIVFHPGDCLQNGLTLAHCFQHLCALVK